MLGLILMLVLLDLPLAIWSERVSAVTATLQHSINSIQQAHAGNPLEVQRRIAALYALHGVKPGLGCLGVMVEWLMYGAALYLFSDWVPRLELDQARFLWVSDLVRPDNGIVLIWCAIAILAGYITFKRRNLAVAGQRFAAALVPLMIAGLAWYYTWPAYGMLAWALLLLSLVLSRGIVRGFVARRA
jgi:membrane protein insertase Oxa1/YidC/SpoIIIJ